MSWRIATALGAGGAALLGVGLVAGYLLARGGGAPSEAPLPQLLAQAHAALDRRDLRDATRLYRQVLARDVSNPEALAHLGNIAYAEGNMDRAIQLYDQALAVDPDYAHALYDKGVALRHGKRDYAGAIAAWRRFLRVMPEGEDAARVRGWINEAEQRGKR